MFRRLFFSIGLSVAFSLIVTGLVRLREARAHWGIRPGEGSRPLAGDDLVPDATIVETRGIDIDAPPSAVWPWLVQMGFGRGGWYSYDAMDMASRSARKVMPEHQALKVGDTMPTHPGGGFRVEAMDPERALVLYLDSSLVAPRTDEGAGATTDENRASGPTPGLRMAGTMGNRSMPDFRGSWAFVLEPLPSGGTRLIERLRFWVPQPTSSQRMFMPLMGTGVFLMTRKHMMGIRDRAEREPTPWTSPSAEDLASAVG